MTHPPRAFYGWRVARAAVVLFGIIRELGPGVVGDATVVFLTAALVQGLAIVSFLAGPEG